MTYINNEEKSLPFCKYLIDLDCRNDNDCHGLTAENKFILSVSVNT